jgi:O-antigen ligase
MTSGGAAAAGWVRRGFVTVLLGAWIVVVALHNGGYDLIARNSLGLAAWWLLALAVATGAARVDRLPPFGWAAVAALTGLAAWTGLSARWAADTGGALFELDRASTYLALFLLAALVVPRLSLVWVANGLGSGIAVVGVLALVSRAVPGSLGSARLQVLLPSAATRLSYPLGYWNGLAVLVAFAFPLLLRAGTEERRRLLRLMAIAPLPVLAVVVYLAASRGGFLAAALGVLVLVAASRRRTALVAVAAVVAAGSMIEIVIISRFQHLVDGPFTSAAIGSEGTRALVWLGVISVATGALAAVVPRTLHVPIRLGRALVAVAVAGVAAVAFAAHPIARFQNFQKPPPALAVKGYVSAHLLSSNGSGRWQFWGAALDQFERHPLNGGGAGSYEAWWAQHGTLATFVRDAHSLELETLSELGVVGLVLLVSFVTLALLAARRCWSFGDDEERASRAALLGVVVSFLLASAIDWMWEMTVVTAVAIVALGALVGYGSVRSRPTSRRLAFRTTLVIVALAGAVIVLVPLLAEIEITRSERAVTAGDWRAAASAAAAARALEPWAATPYLQAALVAERTGDLLDARLQIRAAITRSPDDWRLRLIAARVDAKSGEIESAGRQLRRARDLNPRSLLFAGGR